MINSSYQNFPNDRKKVCLLKKLLFLLLFFGFTLTGCTEVSEEPTKKIITSDEKN